MPNTDPVDFGAISSALIGYQSQLNQMAMALLTGSAVLLFANRKNKKTFPLILTFCGGAVAACAAYKGLHFVETVINDLPKGTLLKDSSMNNESECEMVLIALSTLILSFAALFSDSTT